MNKKNEKKNLKKIISITKEKYITKLPANENRKINRIKNISNLSLQEQQIDISIKKDKHTKRLEISEDEGKKNKNKKDGKEGNNYFDFNAHFKYNDLVDALNTLKMNKNESNSKNGKTIKINEKESNNNYHIISRNVKMNNYVKYLEIIEKDNKIYEILTNIPAKIKKNKTTYFPQSEALKNNILFKFKKDEKKIKGEKISVSKSKSKSKSKEKKYINKSGKITKEKNSCNNDKKYNNLITISLNRKKRFRNSLNEKSNSNNKNKSIKNKSENKTNSKINNIRNKKIKNIKQKIFKKAKYNTNNIFNISEISNNFKKINKQNEESKEKNTQTLSKKNETKANFKSNKPKNIFNLKYNPNNLFTLKKKSYSSSVSRSKNRINNSTRKNFNVPANINIKTLNNKEKSKKRMKNSIIDIINTSKPNTAKNFNSPKPESNEKKISNSKIKLNIISKTKKVSTRKINKRKKYSIRAFLTNNSFNKYSKLDNSLSESNQKNKQKYLNRKQIFKKNQDKIKTLTNHYSVINKNIKEKNFRKRNDEKINDKNYSKRFSKIKSKNNKIIKNSNYNSFQISLENSILNEYKDKKSNKTRISNIKQKIYKNINKNLNINESKNFSKTYKVNNLKLKEAKSSKYKTNQISNNII